jgi:hypothetical protein
MIRSEALGQYEWQRTRVMNPLWVHKRKTVATQTTTSPVFDDVSGVSR